MKMMLIGLGKHEGAKIYHRAIEDFEFDRIVRSVAREVIARCKILAGLAVLENAYDEPARIVALRPADIAPGEAELLRQAAEWLPRLPFDSADVLLVDRIGKDISGTGMDTNVVGRKFHNHRAAADETPRIKRIIVRGLSAHTRGNATGIGIAEFCLSRVVAEMDVEATWVNCVTASHVPAAMIPLHYPTDREALTTAFATLGLVESPDVRLMWVHDTLHLADVCCSAAYLGEAERRDDLQVVERPRPLPFDAAGNLSSPLA
jgi:hypothetical protein